MKQVLFFKSAPAIDDGAIAWLATLTPDFGEHAADYPEPVLMPMAKASSGGDRWITVHPGGKESKGVPVLIRETEHGSGTYHVVGGAGGKLNYLKLRGVKSKEQYAQEVRKKHSDMRDIKTVQRKRDKETGLDKVKKDAHARVHEQKRQAEDAFVRTVAKHAGWDEKTLTMAPEALEGLTPAAAKSAMRDHRQQLFNAAKETADVNMRKLVLDHDARLTEVQDEGATAPAPARSLGYATHYAARAGDADGIKAEATELKAARTNPADAVDPEKPTASTRAKAIREELAAADIPRSEVKAKLVDAAAALEIIRAQKTLKAAARSAGKANSAIDKGETKAYLMEVGSAPTDKDVMRDVANDLKTLKTRAFLSEIGKIDGYHDSLARHIGSGAYNGLNAVSVTTAGTGLVDRDAVDVLGIAGAAQAMAQRMKADLSPAEYKQATEALAAYHVEHYQQRGDEALREAAELSKAAGEITLSDAADGHDIARMHEVQARKREAIEGAHKILGTALGEFEAHAALLTAMKAGKTESLRLPMGKLTDHDAITRLRAIGLQRGDYSVERAGNESIATVSAEGLKRITQPIDREAMHATRESLAVINGERDDPAFWPQGMASRPDMAADAKPAKAGVAANLAEPFAPGPDLRQSAKDYIGGRMADGDSIPDIVADLHSQALVEQVPEGQRADYFSALNDVVPIRTAEGKPMEAEARREAFQQHAEAFVKGRYGQSFNPIHAQTLAPDDETIEAVHRALATEPTAKLAFKAVGDLTAQDQGALRNHFTEHVASADQSGNDLKAELAQHTGREPEKEVDDMFGRATNPAWTSWSQKKGELTSAVNDKTLDWPRYVTLMGGPTAAYAAMQDHTRGRLVKSFADEHNKLKPEAPLKMGRTVLNEHLRHLDAVDPETRDRRLAQHRDMVDSLRDRVGGKYASGSVTEKLDRARESQAAMEQSQMGFFSAKPEEAKAKPMGADERHTIGTAAEQQLGGLVKQVGQNFEPGKPVRVWQPSMMGKYAPQQRAIKLIEMNKRLALAQGVGSGKTSMMLGAFAHLQQQGKVKRGIFAVPSIVQGQFGGEALAMLKPNTFKWHSEPGANRADRIAGYKDPTNHFSVVTHAAFRDDMLHLGAGQAGIDHNAMSEKVAAMTQPERSTWMKGVMAAEGMDHDYLAVDEGHDLLNRKGKEDSSMANVIDAVSSNMSHYVSASADPVKNDPSELFDMLHKMAPTKYQDRDQFMRRYGVDTVGAKESLRRELARHFYPGRIDPGVAVKRTEVTVPLSAGQQKSAAQVDADTGAMRIARLGGTMDIDAAKRMSPDSFADAPADQHEAIAKTLHDSVGILKNTAMRHVFDDHPENSKLDWLSKHVADRKGKPGVVFARSRAAVKLISDRLAKEGHRVITITGSDSSAEKARKKLMFKPEQGEAKGDVLVLSDAGAVGLNAQRGEWLTQFDTPMTAKTHAQRNGRIDRLGQKAKQIELTDLVADHAQERTDRRRLKSKYALRDVLTSSLEGLDDTGFAAYLKQAHQAHQQAIQ